MTLPISRPSRFWSRYLALVERRWGLFLLIAFALAGAGALLATHLELKTDFAELLPKDSQAVRDLHRLEKRLGGVSTLVVGIEGGNWKDRERFAEECVSALRAKLPAGEVQFIDYKIETARAYYDRNRFLYAERSDLETILERLHTRISEEEGRELAVQLDDQPVTPFNVDDIRKKYEKRTADLDHFPDGYFITPDRTLQALLLRIPSAALGENSTDKTVADVHHVLDQLDAKGRGFDFVFGGDPLTALDERQGVVDDLVVVSVSTTLLVILVIVLYYRSVRALLLIGLPVALAVMVAFGVAYLGIGNLNSNTGFLGAIIAGNGINFGIVFLARYEEERRAGRDWSSALGLAVRGTWIGTATAAVAASIAYGSLMATDFRGFSQFGFIGAVGMLLCWVGTFTVTPALVAALESFWPSKVRIDVRKTSVPSGKMNGFWRLMPDLMPNRLQGFFDGNYRWLAALGVLVTLASIVGAARFYRDPFEYNFHNLRSRRTVLSGAAAVGRRVDQIFHGTSLSAGSPAVFLVDKPEQVAPVVAALEERKKQGAPIGRIESIESLLPTDQSAKLALLAEIRRLLDTKVLGWLSEKEHQEALEYRPADDLKPVGVDDLPEVLQRPFVERDGRRGLVIFLHQPPGTDYIRDGKSLLRVAAAIREVKLPNGETLRTSGHEVVVADILAEVLRDAPITTAASFFGVLAITFVALRGRRDRVLVMGILVAGVTWMCGVAALAGMKVNMLNFVALPITFGIGVDYPINIYRRYLQEGPTGLGKTVWTTGSAVALCSLTTIIGYSSLLFADTRALNSFGLLAVIGEVTTLSAALFVLPAFIRLSQRRETAPAQAAA